MSQSALASLLMLLLTITPAQPFAMWAATQRLAAVGASAFTLGVLGSVIVPASRHISVAAITPLSLSLPMLFGLKGLAYLRLRPYLAPAGADERNPRFGFRLAITKPWPTGSQAVRNAATDAGPAAGKLVRNIQPIHRQPVPVRISSHGNTEDDKRAMRATPPSTTSSQDAASQERRSTSATMSMTALRQIFQYVDELDVDRCMLRVVCELAADASLGEGYGEDVAKFLSSLDDTDKTHPWIKFQNAARAGLSTRSRKACHRKFNRCSKSTPAIVASAKRSLIGASK